MGAADLRFDFESCGRLYRIDFTESLMVEYVDLCEVRIKRRGSKSRELNLHQKRWPVETFIALIPGGAAGIGPAAVAKRVKEEMDAGWKPLQ
jgi:hypothetical protein